VEGDLISAGVLGPSPRCI